jgi:hypothetical protein
MLAVLLGDVAAEISVLPRIGVDRRTDSPREVLL